MPKHTASSITANRAILRAVDNDWVIVNGARMRVNELEYLTRQLQQEYTQGLEKKKSMVLRLLNWFKQ